MSECVPTWPGASSWGYPFLDLILESVWHCPFVCVSVYLRGSALSRGRGNKISTVELAAQVADAVDATEWQVSKARLTNIRCSFVRI